MKVYMILIVILPMITIFPMMVYENVHVLNKYYNF